jgi:hypothetical protein
VIEMKKILYKSLFNGWIEITEEQKKNLINHMYTGITAMDPISKQKYINNRFIEK